MAKVSKNILEYNHPIKITYIYMKRNLFKHIYIYIFVVFIYIYIHLYIYKYVSI